ncbi:unnamed protein product [Amoebophrya sp. A25]|nr:unnamed protein product [Amoebophrya sp. A25]|eukprot:GSA25T00027129001.1
MKKSMKKLNSKAGGSSSSTKSNKRPSNDDAPQQASAPSSKPNKSPTAGAQPAADFEQLLSGPALKQAKKGSLASLMDKINGTNREGRQLLPRNAEERKAGERVVVVLEKCFLELVQIRKGAYELLNSDDHKTLLMKNEKRRADIAEARPDITHQCLMTLLDSPLNKKGKLLIYLHTAQNVLIEVHPSLRVPRTFKRFCGLMVELLQKNKIRAAQTNEILMKVIANPVEKYLPPGGRKVGLSVAGESVNARDYCAMLAAEQKAISGKSEENSSKAKADEDSDAEEPTLVENSTGKGALPITFVIGAVAHCDPASESGFGLDYISDKISISPFGLSASCVCSKLCHEFEHLWNV